MQHPEPHSKLLPAFIGRHDTRSPVAALALLAGLALPHVAFAQDCDPGDLFAPQALYDARNQPFAVASGDLNGDGVADLVVSHGLSEEVSVLLNDGDGTFAPEVAYAGVDGLRGLAIGDLDGDGDIDVVVTNRNDLSVSVLLNLGDGTFAPQVAYDASSPVAVAIGDLDGDGDADLAIANDVFVAADSLGVLLNNGDGTFATEVRYDVGVDPAAVVLGDLDGDGDLDAAVANFGPAFFGPGSLSVLLNSGDGMFGSQVEYDAGDGGESPASVAIGDLDGDGDTDLAVANAGGFGDGTLVSVHLNGGDGSFAPQVMYEAGDGAQSVAIGDLDGDGDADLAVANAVSDRVSVLLNLGDGTFGPEVPFSAGDGPRSVALSDFDGDGSLDVATANGGSFRPDGVSVLLNQCGTGTEPCVPDLDGDGELTIFDFLEFQSLFATGDARADLDGSGTLDIFDFLAFQSAFAIGCP